MLLQGLTLSENEGDLEVREFFFFFVPFFSVPRAVLLFPLDSNTFVFCRHVPRLPVCFLMY